MLKPILEVIIFGNLDTISIPRDAIQIVPLLISIGLLIYIFNKLFENQPKAISAEITQSENNSIESKSKLKKKSPLYKQYNNVNSSQINFIRKSKLFKLGSLAILAIGGTGLVALNHNQNLSESLTTSKLEFSSSKGYKSKLSFKELRIPKQNKKESKEIKYITPLFSNLFKEKNSGSQKIKNIKVKNSFNF